MEEFIFCSNCGEKILNDAKFCSQCGMKVSANYPKDKEQSGEQGNNVQSIELSINIVKDLPTEDKVMGNWHLKRILLFGSIVCFIIALFLYKSKAEKEKYIEIVREGRLQAYPEYTVGEAFGDYFKKSSWNYFEGKTEQTKKEGNIVEYRGKCIYAGEEKEIQIQFRIQGGDFEIVYLSLDGVPQKGEVLNEILELVYREPMEIDDVHTYPKVDQVAILCPHTLLLKYGADYYARMTNENGKYLTYGQIADGLYEKIYNIEGYEGLVNEVGDIAYAHDKKDIPEEFYNMTNENIEMYVGTWWDLYSERCNLNIQYESGIYLIDINWSSSAWENTHWTFRGVYDNEKHGIVYDGSQIDEIYYEDGSYEEIITYEDGTGLFYIGNDGYLYWEDWKENIGNQCFFTKEEIVEELPIADNYFHIGDTISFVQNDSATFNLTFTSFGTGEEYGKTYTYIEYVAENTGNEEIYFNDGDIDCYADNYSVNNAYVINGEYNNNFYLSPGRKVSSKIYFDVDINAVRSLQLEFANGIWSIDGYNGYLENASGNIGEAFDFEEDWYKIYSCFESDSKDILKIADSDDGLTHVTVNGHEYFACDNSKYKKDEEGAYVYDDVWDNLQLKYYPIDGNYIVMVVYGEETCYYPVDDCADYIEIIPSIDEPQKALISDAEIYAAGRMFMSQALADTTYSNYHWEYVSDAGITPYLGSGYTATFRVYCESLKSYKYLRVHMFLDSQGNLCYSSSGI